jgi:cysteine/O-acetylserine efflux protein
MQFWLNLLGTAYMLYLALHTLLSKPLEHQPLETGLNTFKAGVLMQFLNLKVILYGITVFSMFITPYFQSPLSVSLFAAWLALVGLAATSCWALGGAIFRNFYQKYYRSFNFVMAALLLYTAMHGLLISH